MFFSVLHEADVHDRGWLARPGHDGRRHVGEVQPAGIQNHEGRSFRQLGEFSFGIY